MSLIVLFPFRPLSTFFNGAWFFNVVRKRILASFFFFDLAEHPSEFL
jgi:hypothetical protein